jgi:hypothetical protein
MADCAWYLLREYVCPYWLVRGRARETYRRGNRQIRPGAGPSSRLTFSRSYGRHPEPPLSDGIQCDESSRSVRISRRLDSPARRPGSPARRIASSRLASSASSARELATVRSGRERRRGARVRRTTSRCTRRRHTPRSTSHAAHPRTMCCSRRLVRFLGPARSRILCSRCGLIGGDCTTRAALWCGASGAITWRPSAFTLRPASACRSPRVEGLGVELARRLLCTSGVEGAARSRAPHDYVTIACDVQRVRTHAAARKGPRRHLPHRIMLVRPLRPSVSDATRARTLWSSKPAAGWGTRSRGHRAVPATPKPLIQGLLMMFATRAAASPQQQPQGSRIVTSSRLIEDRGPLAARRMPTPHAGPRLSCTDPVPGR